MATNRLPMRDPRTVARDIPGISDALFPQMNAGVASYFNKKAIAVEGAKAVPIGVIKASHLSRPMLFEAAYARGEQLLRESAEDWNECLERATSRQRRHFDAVLPQVLTQADITAANWVANNLTMMIGSFDMAGSEGGLVLSPMIPGYQWIASSNGDMAFGSALVEVKCSNKNFGSGDYRQVLMYWLLSYASSLEHDTQEWTRCILLNPRLNQMVDVPFAEIISATTAGRSKVETLELFSTIVGDYALKALPEFKL